MKRTSRRGSSLVFALLLLAATLTGCGAPTADYGNITVPGGIVSAGPEATVTAVKLDTQAGQLPRLEVSIFMNEHKGYYPFPKDTALWNTIRDKAALAAGYRVEPKMVDWLDGHDQFMRILGCNSLPDVMIVPYEFIYLLQQSTTFDTDNKYQFDTKVKILTADDIKQNMPNLVRRVEQYGLDFKTEFLPAQVQTTEKNYWYIPAEMNMDAFTNLPVSFTNNADSSLEYAMMSSFGIRGVAYDNLAVRDDVLKEIYPNAKTEAELSSLYVQQKGVLSVQDVVGDIPIHTLDDLMDFLEKVRDKNLKLADGTSVIPAELGLPIMATGVFDRKPISFGQTAETGDHYMRSPEFKALLKWMNEACGKGLLDPQDYANVDRRHNRQKRASGVYAVMSVEEELDPSYATLDKLRQDLGCGFRLLPMGYGVTDFSQNNNKYTGVRATSTACVCLNAKLSDEKAAAIMKWLDYQMSEEFDELCYWGLPEWSTITGDTRMFKPEYKGLEEWAVSGMRGDKDGSTVGLLSVPLIAENGVKTKDAIMPPDVRITSFFKQGIGYPGAPCYTVPRRAEAILQTSDLMKICNRVMLFQDILPKQTRFLYDPIWIRSVGDGSAEDGGRDIHEYNEYEPFLDLPLVIGDNAKNFEKNWKKMQDHLVDMGINEDTTAARSILAERWRVGFLDRVIQ